jgi:hypothetical protein
MIIEKFYDRILAEIEVEAFYGDVHLLRCKPPLGLNPP